ncbi:hypothetical protein FN846DRAFT_957892 [Sphaerosporella brunnea]|jgi:hypothetical protein|uniref:Uncharacterized protein n=1 Tax=Sphaerosporella brunnea TaxID=1250544 RepID=A0A5J5EQR0_9PEZI|nr:hypothetical protein FN846DRAFT_957892 [Sphaerosporella brunnea]
MENTQNSLLPDSLMQSFPDQPPFTQFSETYEELDLDDIGQRERTQTACERGLGDDDEGVGSTGSEPEEEQGERWSARLTYAGAFGNCAEGTVRLTTIDTPITGVHLFYRQAARLAGAPELNRNQPYPFLLRWRLSFWPAREASIDLAQASDGPQMEQIIRAELKPKRKETAWHITFHLLPKKIDESSKNAGKRNRDFEGETSQEEEEEKKRRKSKVCTVFFLKK